MPRVERRADEGRLAWWSRYVFEHIGSVAMILGTLASMIVTAHIVGSSATNGYALAQANDSRLDKIEEWTRSHDNNTWKSDTDKRVKANTAAVQHIVKEQFKAGVVNTMIAEKLGLLVPDKLEPRDYVPAAED